MLLGFVTQRLAVPHPAYIVLAFFAYAFMGYIMECIVLTAEKKRIVVNRGFTSHLPFCIIYGAGAIGGFVLLAPLRENLFLLYIVGAIAATSFEFLVGTAQQRLFGNFWWDYSEKPFNYKGMLCLESTVFWGFVAIAIVRFLHITVANIVTRVPQQVAIVLAVALLSIYLADFVVSARAANQSKVQQEYAETQEHIAQ